MNVKQFLKRALLPALLALGCAATAQKKKLDHCATMNRLENLWQRQPELKTKFTQQLDEFNKTVDQGNYRGGAITGQNHGASVETPYTIPVVFHIVSTNPAAVTDAQILAQLSVLNEDFAGANADSIQIPDYFKPLAGKSGIRFCLAVRNPDGEPATGINRVTTTKSSFSYQNDPVKYAASGGADSWDTDLYLNIWICTLSDNLLGYATFPEDGVPQAQGVVIDYRGLPGGAYVNYNGGKTLSHEVGHYFNLYHIWGDDDGACTGSDYVTDTPNQADASTGCSSGIKTDNCTTSGNGIMYQNYMDYSYDNCLVLFTAQQVTRMEAALLAYRPSLLASDGCKAVTSLAYDARLVAITAPGQKICSATVNPVVTLKNNGTETLTNLVIYYGKTGAAPALYNWTGSLAQYASADVTLPSVMMGEGTSDLIIFTTNPNGHTDEDTGNDTLEKQVQYYDAIETLEEGFETTTFPPLKWDVLNPDGGISWERTASASRTGTAAAMIRNYGYSAIGQTDDLRLPVLSVQEKDSAWLSFDVAAATYTATSTTGNNWDTLQVLISQDCGNTYTSVYKKYGSTLVTRTQAAATEFYPTANEWRTDSVNLGAYIDKGNILVAFRNSTGYENNIFLDNIRLRTVVVNPNLKAAGFLLTPNPVTGILQVQFYPQPTDLQSLEIYSITGQKLMVTKIATGQASNLYTFDMSRFAPGVYMVKAVLGSRVVVKRVVKQ